MQHSYVMLLCSGMQPDYASPAFVKPQHGQHSSVLAIMKCSESPTHMRVKVMTDCRNHACMSLIGPIAGSGLGGQGEGSMLDTNYLSDSKSKTVSAAWHYGWACTIRSVSYLGHFRDLDRIVTKKRCQPHDLRQQHCDTQETDRQECLEAAVQ